ncbi:DUF6497 family protein [uncultured Sulfitobacter sp.]|uniref:DUF6497 family protein n=1 Tax=uncultured Sulfitobacter sp. TaxID=191468 RepID=UPI002623B395|nr:DUF6497 family protein [uncultured Sulfitobacter sp.]
MKVLLRFSLIAILVLSGPASGTEVPSGQKISLHEVLVDAQGDKTWLRFRFLAPQIARGETQIPFDLAGDDMLHLCDTFVLPYMDEYALAADKIVISMMDRITEFGQPDPDATQYFESFRTENGVCIWDDF